MAGSIDNLASSREDLHESRRRAERTALISKIQDQLVIEQKVKAGAENMLKVSEVSRKGETISREQVESQLEATNKRIATLGKQLEAITSVAPKPRLHLSSEGTRGDSMSQNTNVLVKKLHERAGSNTSGRSRRSEVPFTPQIAQNLSDVLLRMRSPGGESYQVRVECMGFILRFMRMVVDWEEHLPVRDVMMSMRACLVDPSKETRATGFRVLRHLVVNLSMAEAMFDVHIDVFIIRALTRDQRYDVEREQAMKLVRSIMDIPGGVSLIPQSVVRTIIAIAEQSDDKLRNVSLETLCELAIRNLRLLALSGGTKVIFMSLFEGPKDLTDVLVKTVVYILDTEDTRCYLRPGVEIEMIVSQFTDAFSRGPAHEDRLTSCAKALLALFKTWTGIIYLCQDNRRAVKCIVEALSLPFDENRKLLIDMLFEIFRLKMPKWGLDLISNGGRLGQELPLQPDLYDDVHTAPLFGDRMSLIDHYLTMILVVFIESRLLEALFEVIQNSTNKHITVASTILISEILEMCNRLLPAQYATRIQSLPSLFSLASNFKDENRRHTATLALSHIDLLQRQKERMWAGGDVSKRGLGWSGGFRSGSEGSSRRQMENVKMKMSLQIDDQQFRNMIVELEKVIGSKDHTKWNWDSILELVQGPLSIPRRLEEVIKTTKIVKRLLYFYRPLNHQFSDMKRSKSNSKYVQAGCEIFKSLVATSEGVRYLAENKLLPEIAECLEQLEPAHGSHVAELMFAKDRMEKTLTGEYFTLLGILTQTVEGVSLLERFNIYNLFYRLTELRSRDDILKALVSNMDYTKDGHPRIILSKIMTSGHKNVRLYATNHLRYLLRSDVQDFSDWAIRLLVTQLYDPATEVCEKSISVLDLACNDKQNLEAVVRLRPSLDHLPEAGNPLLLRFLSTSKGFRYLQQWGYTEREMDYWYETGNIYYVMRLELSLGRALSAKVPRPHGFLETSRRADEEMEPDNQEMDGTVPPHFYGELTKTNEGCDLLRRSGHFQGFANIIREFGSAVSDIQSLLYLKSTLWAVGNIGATETGLPFLLKEDIIKDIIAIAENSPILSLRGTAFYVLGLVARTAAGVDALEEHGWESVLSPSGQFEGLCVPANPSTFLRIQPCAFKGSWPTRKIGMAAGDFDDTEQQILKFIGNMSNQVLSTAAGKTLSRMTREHAQYFAKMELYIEVLRMLSIYHYRLTIRRFIQELFERIPFTDAALERLDLLEGLRVDVEDALCEDGSAGGLGGMSNSDEEEDDGESYTSETHEAPRGEDKKKVPDNRIVLQPLNVTKGF